VNIDYEGELGGCTNNDPTLDTSNQTLMTRLAKDMRAGLDAAKPGYYLSIDTYSGSAEGTGTSAGKVGIFSIPDLNQYVDSFMVMAYDMDWANYNAPPLNCSSYCFNPVSPLNTYQFNVTSSMQEYTSLVPPTKVILGQPYYGSRGCVASSGPAHQTLVSNYVNTTYLYASTIGSQSGVSSLSQHRDPSDGVSEWDTWYDTDWNCWREQYYDDVVSLGAKYDVINQMNLRGVGLFTLDYGGGSPELWQELDVKFATTTPWSLLGGVITGNPVVVSSGANRLDVFIRGQEGALWHQSWNGTGWSGWEDLGGALGADPDVVATSPTELDVFIRGQEGGLWQRTWNGSTWGPWQSLGGVIQGAPSAVSLNSVRLDVFVEGQEGGLWQRTWNGSAWGSWQGLGGVLTAPPTAEATGGSRIDVFHRGTDYALWERSWSSTGGWGGFVSLGGYLPANPPAVLDTPSRIDVFARGWDGGLWQNTWSGSAWAGWQSHGGVMLSAPLVTSCTAGHMDVFHVGTDTAIWQLGYNGTAWGAFQRLGGQWTANPSGHCALSATSTNLLALDYNRAVWEGAATAT
jgi:glycosyl hydrolase family 18 (putative chitinase)